jgi:hypothetical protein
MSLTINAPDSLRKQVEAASQGRCTVVYTAKGQPCFMRVIPSFTLQSIDASLGTGTHPAFIVGGVTKSELLIGMYGGAESNGELVSQPGKAVKVSINHDAGVALARANGAGWHLMTNAEWAAIGHRCWADGFDPRGNTNNGRSSDDTAEYGVSEAGDALSAGGGDRILSGSGPQSWRHDDSPWGAADLNGNVWEWSPGMRIVDGEIHVIADNDAAGDAADFSDATGPWQAIDGATGALVAPGHANAVHYAAATSGTADYTLYRNNGGTFEGMANSSGANPVAADALALCKALGLFPVASDLGGDGFYISTAGERLPRRGGSWLTGSLAGVRALALFDARAGVSTNIGVRPAFVA